MSADLTGAEWATITHLLETQRMRILNHEHGDYCDEGCEVSGPLRDAIDAILATRSDNSVETKFPPTEAVDRGSAALRAYVANAFRWFRPGTVDRVSNEILAIVGPGTCDLLPNEDGETCLTQGVGRDRACPACLRRGWGKS